jgi:SAM-dependent methyltransferase
VGCGNGQLWVDNRDRVPADLSVTLTDISEGMLNDAQRQLAGPGRAFVFALADAQKLSFPSSSFDAVIANHILYHVPHIDAAVSEFQRVLKPGGSLYCTTNGDGYMTELGRLLSDFDERMNYAQKFVLSFTLQRGPAILSKHFNDIEVRPFEDSLAITNADHLIDYILSTGSVSNAVDLLEGQSLERFRQELSRMIVSDGSIRVSKESGMLIARKSS